MPAPSPRRCPRVVATLLLLVLAVAGGPLPPPASAHTAAPRVMFTISSPMIIESSSLVVSTVHPGLVYTANDSGDSATIYVLSSATGHLVGRTSLKGVNAIDFEAMAGGSDGSLVIGDVGDNNKNRDHVAVYKIRQPGRGRSWVRPQAVTLRYSNGPRDAESILFDARSGRVFIASKQFTGARIYRTPPSVFQRRHALLTPIRSAPIVATDATFIRSQHYVVIRTYFVARVYTFPGWHQVTSFVLPPEPQGESVAGPPGGRAIWVGSEGKRSKVIRVALPDLARSSPAAPPATTTTTVRTETVVASRDHQGLRTVAWVVLCAAAVALLVVLGIGLALRQRHRQLRRTSPRPE